MSVNDMFADIALSDHPVGSDDLVEFAPPLFEKKFLKESAKIADVVKEPSFYENLDRFKDELNFMREKFSPFLKDHVPDNKVVRRIWEFREFKFRYKKENDNDFKNVLDGTGEWETVTIPDYRGPAGIKGKWIGFYRAEFEFNKSTGKRVYLVFKGADYIADVYLNNKCVGTHEGFFAPFEFDVTDILKDRNVLVVEVKNDFPTMGVQENPVLDGDKIYAATGLGWDDPLEGWHHCPPGAGIYNKVYLEERSELYVKDIFVRPDIDDDTVEVWVDIFNSSDALIEDFSLYIAVYDRNIKGEKMLDKGFEALLAGPGINYYRYLIPMSKYRLWETDNPWLYTARVSIIKEKSISDVKDRIFGMRKFHMDEVRVPKGTLYLNNQTVFLRGANEMGNLQQCVTKNDFEQLIDDILIAKIANLNFYRITQRPVQEEIYDYFDMLGMMHQCDFPLFAALRRNQFYEAIRQAGEMERLIRGHPSSVMVTFINEPVAIRKHEDPNHKYNKRYRQKAHRHLFRKELEYFFEAARKAILLENPDRVVKNVEGDYDPPTMTGLSDFHCYCMWYTNHAVPMGKFYKGYLPFLKRGWKTGCGEYGTEGLDNYEVMRKYPAGWLRNNNDKTWSPRGIVKSQTATMHGDWFEEKDNISDWIYESQKHQSLATGIMTDVLRRRADIVVSSAVHLLIDAWPSGWMKALVGVDRIPKPAYFALKKSLDPVRVNLRSDRWKVYSGETVGIEIWLLNDTHNCFKKCKVVATLRGENKNYESFEMKCELKQSSSEYLGTIKIKIPDAADRTKLFIDANLVDCSENKINEERFTFETFSKVKPKREIKAAYLGTDACNILSGLDIYAVDYEQTKERTADTILVSSIEDFCRLHSNLTEQMSKGAKVVILTESGKIRQFDLCGIEISVKNINPVYFAAFDRISDIMRDFKHDDFSYWYNAESDMIDFIAQSYINKIEVKPILYTYKKAEHEIRKERMPVVGTLKLSSGEITICCLKLEGRIGYNPVLDRFVLKLMGFI